MSPGEIKRLRETLGLTQQHFAAVMCVAFATVNRWEKGRCVPSPVFRLRLRELRLRLKKCEK